MLWYESFTGNGCSMVRADDVRSTSEVVYSALIVIMQFCNNIMNAKICKNDLTRYRRSTEQLQALCIGANSGSVPLCPRFDHIKNSMDLCSKKFDYVVKYKEMIEVVVKHCSKICKGMHV